MYQPEPNPFINHIKVDEPVLTINTFTVNPKLLISFWACVGLLDHVKHGHPYRGVLMDRFDPILTWLEFF